LNIAIKELRLPGQMLILCAKRKPFSTTAFVVTVYHNEI